MLVFLLIALLCYLASAFYAVIIFAMKGEPIRGLLRTGVWAGFLAHTLAIVAEGRKLGYFPVISPKEVSSFIGWAIIAYYLVMSRRYHARALPTFLLPLVFLFTLGSMLLQYPADRLSQMLESAITANLVTQIIFPVHVIVILFSYAAFTVTFVSGVMYLFQERELKTKHFGPAFERLPALNTCDELGYRSLSIGFVLLSLGIITGVFWNQQRDGRWWHNDPKEVMALATWLLYSFVMHYRLMAGWRGRRFAWLAIVGFLIVLLTWIGARALGGYHVFGAN